MKSNARSSRRSSVAVAFLAAALIGVTAGNGVAAAGTSLSNLSKGSSKVSAQLRGATPAASPAARRVVRADESSRVQAYVHVRTLGAGERAALEAQGVEIEIANQRLGIVQGWIPSDRLDAVAGLEFVERVTPPAYGVARTGSRTTKGDSILRADELRVMGFSGQGAKVGVISDGANARAESVLLGDLPPGVVVFGTCNPAVSGSTCNEGTAMLEIVHDLAPGADLAVCSANTSLEFIQCVGDLQNSFSATVIVDDLLFFNEPFFEDGAVAQAADDAAQSGVVFVSAAGNEGSADQSAHYAADFLGVTGLLNDSQGKPIPTHDFGAAAGGASDPTMRVKVPAGGSFTAVLQWGDPFGAAADDYDLLIIDDAESQILASSQEVQNGTQDPVEITSFGNNQGSDQHVRIVIAKAAGADKPVQLLVNGEVTVEAFSTAKGSIVGHPAAANVLAVGAISADDPGHDTIEPFSSQGPTDILFPSAESRAKPDICGIDGVAVTGVGGFGSPFFGTSASSPHVAGVAALLLGGFPASNADAVRSALTGGAVDLGAPGDDPVFGAGRADAVESAKKLDVPPHGTITAPTGAVSIKPGQSVSFAGTCASTTANTQFTADWVFGSGIADSPSFTPGAITFPAAGTYPVTFTCTDGLGLADSAPPSVTVTVRSPHSGGGCSVSSGSAGGAEALAALATLLGLIASKRARSRASRRQAS